MTWVTEKQCREWSQIWIQVGPGTERSFHEIMYIGPLEGIAGCYSRIGNIANNSDLHLAVCHQTAAMGLEAHTVIDIGRPYRVHNGTIFVCLRAGWHSLVTYRVEVGPFQFVGQGNLI